MRLGGLDIERRLSDALFGLFEISQDLSLSNSKQRWMPIGYVIYGTLVPFTYRRGFCVARSDRLGNARASNSGTGNRYDSTLFYF